MEVHLRAIGVRELKARASQVLLPEVAGAVARRTGDPRLARRAVDAVLRLPALRRVLVDDSRARRRGSSGGSVAEGPMQSISRAGGGIRLPLVPWDKEQRARAARLVEVLGPQEGE